MADSELNLNTLFEEILKYKQEVAHLEEIVSNTNSVFEDKLNSQIVKLEKLEEDFEYSKEINEKACEYILLELEHILDKHNFEFNKKNEIMNEINEQLKAMTMQSNLTDPYILYISKKMDSYSKSISIMNDEIKKLKDNNNVNILKECEKDYETKIHNVKLELEYLKKNTFIKKITNPFAYFVIVVKSKSNQIRTNIQLYQILKNNSFFDVGYYLNENPDIKDSKWCKYFSPELHYVCKGFDEKRKINKNSSNSTDKKELIDEIRNNS